MSISRNYTNRSTIFECDTCGDEYEAEGLDFFDAYEEYKDSGGIARLEGDEWEHHCENCR